MARTESPYFGTRAMGQLGMSLIASTWKNRPYTKKYVRPADPRTTAQRSRRAMIGFLTTQWSAIAADLQADWKDLPAPAPYSPYHNYLTVNARRWAHFTPPGQDPEFPDTVNPPVFANVNLFPEENQVRIRIRYNPVNLGWGLVLYFRQNAYPDATIDYAQQIQAFDQYGFTYFIQHNANPGTSYYYCQAFQTNGIWDPYVRSFRVILP